MLRRTFINTAIAALWAISLPSFAVTADEAAALKSTLTPLGAEKAGNKDGSIPSWDGGLNKAPAGYQAGAQRPDPFAAEKSTVQISAKNMDQYKDKLSEGVQALMRKYPSFRVDVYPTHRTASAPQWVYDNTFANATRAKSTQGGNNIENAFGGIPFPIPKTGAEVMWNHLLRWKGESVEIPFRVWVGAADGSRTMAVEAKDDHQFPYYQKDGSLEKFGGEFMFLRQVQTDPPFKAGESILLRDPIDQIGKGRQAWQYLTGQRRVRRAPTIAFDTPDFVASGQNYFDEVFMFLGSLERYEWKIVGKKEIYVPYNNNRFQLAKTDEVFVPHHLNPEKMRWELHRVWVVEANLAPGKRHVVPKKQFYVDEDSWSVLLVDGYDAQGKLWRTQHAVPFVAPEIPAVVSTTFTVFNLQAGTWLVNNLYNDLKSPYKVVPRRPDAYFSADALAGAGIR
ncbi:DUF1329 domain-containing protein [Ferribacterium limneticum]|uniref:DUF1329 domain-containing protein n=1 Tax=Ferribacterium limneticum TaxID=76259 RepID=UPI001CFA30AE|nr:DUF1329 domain-containing protein [Ferribacterium limneticum]UCV17887.1 DUF1329 domain-containing protein [Ferribacterium limneticum]